jgi:hypothetical protein
MADRVLVDHAPAPALLSEESRCHRADDPVLVRAVVDPVRVHRSDGSQLGGQGGIDQPLFVLWASQRKENSTIGRPSESNEPYFLRFVDRAPHTEHLVSVISQSQSSALSSAIGPTVASSWQGPTLTPRQSPSRRCVPFGGQSESRQHGRHPPSLRCPHCRPSGNGHSPVSR